MAKIQKKPAKRTYKIPASRKPVALEVRARITAMLEEHTRAAVAGKAGVDPKTLTKILEGGAISPRVRHEIERAFPAPKGSRAPEGGGT